MAGFPEGFLLGASTASIQCEGGNERSTFAAWSRRKGWTEPGAACGSWERFEQDLACLKALGANAYRFSLEWSRVEPEPGKFDAAAFDRYGSWIERLKAEGIRPIVCLHHWSEPSWRLERRPDGWLSPESSADFRRYAGEAARRLGGLADDWLVFNEPMNFLVASYGAGHFPPGRRMLWNANGRFSKQLMPRLAAAHADAARLLRAANPSARIGVAMNVCDAVPATGSSRDAAAAEAWDEFFHRRFVELILPELDFVGINYYTRIYVKKAPLPLGFPVGAIPGYAEFERALGPLFSLFGGRPQDEPRTSMGWTVDPDGLRRQLLRAWRRWGKPLMVTENGMADTPGLSREAFIRDHLAATSAAMAEGAKVLGYLHWTLLDNWEWGSYEPKFGLFTRERAPKDGVEAFKSLAEAR